MSLRLDHAVEAALYALVAGVVFSAGLRDASALGLLALLALRRANDADLPLVLAIAAFLGATILSAVASTAPEESFAALRFYPIGLLLFLGTGRVVASGGAGRLGAMLLAVLAILSADVIWQWMTGASFVTGRGTVWRRYTGSLRFPSDLSMLPILLPLAALPFARLRDRQAVRGRAGALGAAADPGQAVRGQACASGAAADPGQAVRGQACASGAAADPGLWILAGAVGTVTAAVVFSGTRTAWIAALLAPGAIAWAFFRRSAGAILAGSAVLVSVIAIVFSATPAVKRLLTLQMDREQRFVQWRAAVELFREAPFVGHGPHRFRQLVTSRAKAGEPAFRAVDLRYAPYPHNLYLEALAGTGLVGLASFCLLLAQPFRLLRKTPEALVSRAAAASMALFAIVGLLDMSLTKDWIELCLWMSIGAAAGAAAPIDVPEG